jgi:hypothetical protein
VLQTPQKNDTDGSIHKSGKVYTKKELYRLILCQLFFLSMLVEYAIQREMEFLGKFGKDAAARLQERNNVAQLWLHENSWNGWRVTVREVPFLSHFVVPGLGTFTRNWNVTQCCCADIARFH